ncbi:MAG: hypothetical protein HC893_10625 [Chloroflexaceae bacterium]|nr:hypothetical protein [Chloroflexaceae bacterium]
MQAKRPPYPRSLHRLAALLGVLLLLAACALPFNEERRYLSMIVTHARSTAQILQELQTLTTQANLGDRVWETNVNGQLAALELQIAEIRTVTPPAQFASFHQRYLDTMNTLEQGISLYSQAMALQQSAIARCLRPHPASPADN